MKPLFSVSTDDLLFIRSSYVDDINWWKNKFKDAIDNNAILDYPHDYIQFKELQIKEINIELIQRGVVK